MAPSIAFAANARYGAGGQGEFLRLMAHALARRGDGRIYSRSTPASVVDRMDVALRGTARAAIFHTLTRMPRLRARHDWLTLLSDVDFDAQVAARIDPPDLFDGITAQCTRTIDRLARGSTKLIVTCLNTHVTHLARVLDEEHRRIGFHGWSFVHPRMRRRALHEIARADHLRVNSNLAKTTFVDEGVAPGKVTVIHPGVDLDHFHVTPKRDSTFRILAISSIDPRKGIQYLLQAFEAARLPNAELLLIGGTGDRWGKRMLADFTSRHGNITRRSIDIMTADAATVFGPASVLVHAAIEDGYGLVIPQALACGRPVIATRASGAAELIRHGETGFVVEARSVPQLVEALRLLAHDHALWTAMCERCRPSVEHLTYDAFARDVDAMYAGVRGAV